MNPKKTDGGILISAYACSPVTAADEFMLFRQEYQQNTWRTQENEVIGYHVRQAFKPDEITPEEANEIGKELASRMTNDQFAYVVATHIDKHHIHNHIIICSADLDGQHKYRDVKQSAKDLAQISDSLCREHSLSVIQNPQDKTVTYDKWQGNQRRFTHRDELRMIIDTLFTLLRVQSPPYLPPHGIPPLQRDDPCVPHRDRSWCSCGWLRTRSRRAQRSTQRPARGRCWQG